MVRAGLGRAQSAAAGCAVGATAGRTRVSVIRAGGGDHLGWRVAAASGGAADTPAPPSGGVWAVLLPAGRLGPGCACARPGARAGRLEGDAGIGLARPARG